MSQTCLKRLYLRQGCLKSVSEIQSLFDGSLYIFFFGQYVVVNFNYHLLGVAHQLGDALYGNGRYLITESGAVVMSEEVGGKGWRIHLPLYLLPHAPVAALCHVPGAAGPEQLLSTE